MGYGYTSDKQERQGFIDKAQILQYVTEEEIFGLVLGYLPREFEYVVSPFREDKTPGCWFERRSGTLRLIDFAGNTKYFPDCFDAVQILMELPNFYRTLEFIHDNLIAGRCLVPLQKQPVTIRERIDIKIEARNFLPKDGNFWGPYGISRQDLMSDKVFAVSRYVMDNTRNGNIDIRVKKPCYAYTGFNDGRKKLYFPYNNKEDRFITDCNKNDIGCIESLPLYGDQLIITKSYKDCRVIRNLGRNSVWFQNEGMIPRLDILANLVKRFDNVIVLFDNDNTGIEQSLIISETINEIFPRRSRPLWIPQHLCNHGITDPADMYKELGPESVREFFNSYLI